MILFSHLILQNFFAPDILSTSQTPTNYTDVWSLETSCMGGGFFSTSFEGYGVSYMIYGEDLSKYFSSSNDIYNNERFKGWDRHYLTSITASLVIMYVETFKTNVIVFIRDVMFLSRTSYVFSVSESVCW